MVAVGIIVVARGCCRCRSGVAVASQWRRLVAIAALLVHLLYEAVDVTQDDVLLHQVVRFFGLHPNALVGLKESMTCSSFVAGVGVKVLSSTSLIKM